jgi:hypothetical protein
LNATPAPTGAADIDRRHRDRCRAQRAAQETHVLAFVVGNFIGVGLNHRVLEGHLLARNDRARGTDTGGHAGGQSRARCCIRVELRFEVLQIQREIEDFGVGGCGRSRQARTRPAAARTDQGSADETQTQAARVAEKLSTLQAALDATIE